MIRENQKYFNGLQIFLDLAILILSYILAYEIRFELLKDGIPTFTLLQSLGTICLSIPIYFILYSWFDLYSSKRTKSFSNEALVIICTNIVANLLFIVALYLLKEMHFSRKTLLFFVIINSTLTILYRGFIRFILRKYRKKGYNLKHCLIIGTSSMGNHLIEKIQTHPSWGYNIVGCIRSDDRKSDAFCGYRILGDINELPDNFQQFYIDIAMS